MGRASCKYLPGIRFPRSDTKPGEPVEYLKTVKRLKEKICIFFAVLILATGICHSAVASDTPVFYTHFLPGAVPTLQGSVLQPFDVSNDGKTLKSNLNASVQIENFSDSGQKIALSQQKIGMPEETDPQPATALCAGTEKKIASRLISRRIICYLHRKDGKKRSQPASSAVS